MKFYRLIESLIKKAYNKKNTTKNKNLKKAFKSALYNTSTNQKYIHADLNHTNYILKNNEEITKRIFLDGKFDFEILKKGFGYLKNKKRKYLINVGAHVGTTLIPAIKNHLFEKYIAFEPSLDNFRLLNANINLNEIEKKGVTYNSALSNKASRGFLKKFDKLNSGDYRLTKQKNGEVVQLDILDDFITGINQKNTLIYIDAQGHEPQIFLGGKKMLNKKVPIIFEFSPSLMTIKRPEILYKSIKHYKHLTDLKKNKVLSMGEKKFLEIYSEYKKSGTHTDLMVF